MKKNAFIKNLLILILFLIILPVRIGYTKNVFVAEENRNEYNVLQFGAIPDGNMLNTGAIQQAIDACSQAGGGRVFFPEGKYLTGTIVMKDNVTLHLDEGAEVRGSPKIDDYKTPSNLGLPYKGNAKYLVLAADVKNIGFSGKGKINGNGNTEAFWKPQLQVGNDGRPKWREAAERPSKLVELIGCQDVHIEDITLENSPAWTLHLLKCDRVTVKGINIYNKDFLRNQDGIDIDACRDVDISDCTVLTTDDAIVLKNTNTYNTKRTSEHIRVANCALSTLCNAFKIGTETQDDIKDVVFTDSKIYNHFLDMGILTPQNPEAGIALMTMDGGNISEITISNIAIKGYRIPLYLRLGNRGTGQKVPVSGTLKNISINHLSAVGASATPFIAGLPQHDIEGVKLEDISIATAGGKEMKKSAEIPEIPETYPMPTMFGDLPAYGLYARHVNGLMLKNININTNEPDGRHGMFGEDIKNLDVDQLQISTPADQSALIKLVQSKKALIHNCKATDGTYNFLNIKGDLSEDIEVKESDLMKSEIPFLVENNEKQDIISQSDNLLLTGVTVVMDGQVQRFATPTLIINDKVMVPMREFLAKLDVDMQGDESTMEINEGKRDNKMRLQIGNKTANQNVQEVDLDQPPSVINGIFMIPIRFVSEALGFSVKWEENTRTVKISTPGREENPVESIVQAENMALSGYVQEKNPAASNNVCIKTTSTGTAKYIYSGFSGIYTITVAYFDETDGTASYKLYIADKLVDQWDATEDLASASPVVATLTTRTVNGIKVEKGDEIKIEGTANGGEPTRIDYIEVQ